MKYWIIFLSIGSAAGGIGYFYLKQKPPLHEKTGTVTKGTLTQKISTFGKIIPKSTALMSAPYPGYIDKLYVRIGQKVKKYQPIIRIAPTLDSSVQDAYPLRAPFTGTVVQVFTEEGQYMDPTNSQKNASLVRLDDLSQLQVTAGVQERDINKLYLGQKTLIKVAAATENLLEGIITEIFLSAVEGAEWYERSKISFPVIIKISNPIPEIRPGMNALIDIIASEKKEVLLLEHHFVYQTPQDNFVILTSGEKKSVTLGDSNEDVIEITSGLTEGEKVKPVDFETIEPL